jgi:hypothetical protein
MTHNNAGAFALQGIELQRRQAVNQTRPPLARYD